MYLEVDAVTSPARTILKQYYIQTYGPAHPSPRPRSSHPSYPLQLTLIDALRIWCQPQPHTGRCAYC